MKNLQNLVLGDRNERAAFLIGKLYRKGVAGVLKPNLVKAAAWTHVACHLFGLQVQREHLAFSESLQLLPRIQQPSDETPAKSFMINVGQRWLVFVQDSCTRHDWKGAAMLALGATLIVKPAVCAQIHCCRHGSAPAA